MRPSQPIVFNNAPATMVAVLSDAVIRFVPFFPVLEGLMIGVDKPDSTSPNKTEREAILTVNGAAYLDNGTSKEVGFNLNLYAGNFDDLVELGRALETVINSIKGGGVRYCAVDLPALEIPEDEETNFHSLMTFTAVLGGKSLSL